MVRQPREVLVGIACPNASCPKRGRVSSRNVAMRGYYATTTGRRRRYRCITCGKTFCKNTGTPYYRLHASRSAFDKVAALAVEGTSISAIGRLLGRSWSTAARWLGRAHEAAVRFNAEHGTSYELVELQVDELSAAVPASQGGIWVFAAIEVSSRLWPATVVGRRTSMNTRRLLGDV
ncbi:MAG: IS1 family transposase, partial [bacterium]|nr:IS1 family transposase [bacterium]